MNHSLDRRGVLATGACVLGTALLDPTPALWAQASQRDDPLPPGFPSQDADSVHEVVSVSHFSLEKVRALVDARPELANAAWDWGFGDWETALGAASHTGNYDIAAYLIDHAARPDIFTAAMTGNLTALRALIEQTGGIQTHLGPHGITLRRHAELGGERAKVVLDYLDSLGDADTGHRQVELELDKERYLGSYRFGPGSEGQFSVVLGRSEQLMIRRGEGTARSLFHQGDHVFHPAGAPSARVHFEVSDDVVRGLAIRNPELIVVAPRA